MRIITTIIIITEAIITTITEVMIITILEEAMIVEALAEVAEHLTEEEEVKFKTN